MGFSTKYTVEGEGLDGKVVLRQDGPQTAMLFYSLRKTNVWAWSERHAREIQSDYLRSLSGA